MTDEQIISIIQKSPFLRHFQNSPEIIFAPLVNIPLKDGWRSKPIVECGERLIALTGFAHDRAVRIHPRIFPAPVYFESGIAGALPVVFVREGVARALLDYIAALPDGFGIIAYDGYRPISVQQALFDDALKKFGDRTEVFVSRPSLDPLCPSPHNTGGAIDFQICDVKSGRKIDYGCGFDDFRPSAHLGYFEAMQNLDDIDTEAMLNVRVAANLARAVGFDYYWGEKWHFDKGDQWDSRADVARYGSCDLGGIAPDPNVTIMELIK